MNESVLIIGDSFEFSDGDFYFRGKTIFGKTTIQADGWSAEIEPGKELPPSKLKELARQINAAVKAASRN